MLFSDVPAILYYLAINPKQIKKGQISNDITEYLTQCVCFFKVKENKYKKSINDSIRKQKFCNKREQNAHNYIEVIGFWG